MHDLQSGGIIMDVPTTVVRFGLGVVVFTTDSGGSIMPVYNVLQYA
jgi:hypothetical protein